MSEDERVAPAIVPPLLRRLFSPRSIAIIGASRNEASVSGQPLANLRNHGYAGTLYPVNPRYDEIAGLRCYPSVAALPACPDLALIVVGARTVPGILRECAAIGVPYALIMSSGFAEAGPEGVLLQQELDAVVRRYGIGVVGPNCQGLMNPAEGVFAGFGAAFQIPELTVGPVSLVTQSGGFGFAVVSMAEEAGVGFRHVVSTGNESSIGTLDFMRHFIADPDTRIVAAYIEGLKDARGLLEIGDLALAADKPIMVWKVGTSEVGQRAAISHTANLGGSNDLYRALFRQRGIIEVGDVQDLTDFTRALLYGRRPTGRGVGIVTISGGAGVVMADAFSALGIETPALSAHTKRRLREVVPSFGSVENPVDVTGNIFNDPQLLPRVLRIVAEDESIDSLVVIPVLLQGAAGKRFAEDVVELNGELAKPIVVCWSAREKLARDAYAILDARSIPHYPTPIRAARALHAITTYGEAQRRAILRKRAGGLARAEESVVTRAQAVGLSEYAAKALLASHRIRITREGLARSREEAVALGAKIGYPVVVKASSADIAHKTECGAVRVGLSNAAEVADAYDEVLRNARAHAPAASIDGVLVQEMIAGGIETIIGVTNDPRFGPALMFGLGGIFAEVMRDVSWRVCPIDAQDALEMIREIKGYAVLNGARGAARADIPALADALMRISTFAIAAESAMAELDINPLFVLPEGRGVVAADALIVPATASAAIHDRDGTPATCHGA